MKYFYSHLINIESTLEELDKLSLSMQQKNHLCNLVDSLVHHTVCDLILSQLSSQDKVMFLQKLQQSTEKEELMKFLNLKITDIEKQIDQAVEEVKRELYTDIEHSKKGNLK